MTHLHIGNEATLWSVSHAELSKALASQPLLIVMHGWGSNEQRIYPIATVLPHWQRFVIAAIRGPIVAGPDAFGWFTHPHGGQDGTDDRAFADPCRAVIRWLGTIEMQYEVAIPRVSLLGFSQGGAMATHLMRMNPTRFASAVNLSGYWPHVEVPTDAQLSARKPPLFWGRDESDAIIRPPAIERTLAALPKHFELEARTYADVGHGISAAELVDAGAFLERTLREG